MPYKVTALKNVTIKAMVRTQVRENIGTDHIFRPSEREEWITLRAGEVRDGLGLVLETHPKHGLALAEQGFLDGDLPKEFGGLYRLEISSASA